MSEVAVGLRHYATLLPSRVGIRHKGEAGRLTLIAGSLRYPGAALLAARAAERSGVGVVQLALPAPLLPLFASRVIETTLLELPVTVEGEPDPARIVDALGTAATGALIVGPGLLPSATLAALVRTLAGVTTDAPLLLDAGALRAVAQHGGVPPATRPLILTPHEGEFAALAGTHSLFSDDAVQEAADRFHTIVILKGEESRVALPGGGAVERIGSANPALSIAGSGDVLTGLIGAYAAQGCSPATAARLAIAIHAIAGRLLAARFGPAGGIASDLVELLPAARAALIERGT